tara:strand:+ start:1037 stop:1441 length:405 start_codon:yes stop_codon:yes gene_type:complete
MSDEVEIYCLNKRHSNIVSEFLRDLQDIIDEATYYDEEYEGFKDVIARVILFHNGLGIYTLDGEIDKISWYLSMPNTVYWATVGYFAALTPKKEENLDEYRKKVLSLIENVVERLELSLLIQPGTENEEKINLN